MLFSRATTSLLKKSIPVVRRAKFSSGAEEAASEGGSLAVAVATTFGTYMLADFLSNFIQHPTQKVCLLNFVSFWFNTSIVPFFFSGSLTLSLLYLFLVVPSRRQMDYGYFNSWIGRPVDQNFWGTRTEHIVGVAACLAVTDHASQAAFGRYLGRPLCFAKSPATFVAHTFLFIFSGVAIYCAGDAAFNPNHANERRAAELKSGLYSTYIGSCTAWFEPYVAPALAKTVGPAIASTWLGSSLLPATLAYSTVKGVGWYDWGNCGLNDHEMKLNGLAKD